MTTKTTLVVDDDVDIRGSLKDLLEDQGYAVHEAANGREALDYLREHPTTSVVLLDLMMPIMDGYQFRIEQQRDPAIAGVPVVVMTARGTVKPSEVGVEYVLQKPFKLAKLLDTIQRAQRADPAEPTSATERAPSSSYGATTTTGVSVAPADEPCEATLNGAPERRCMRRGPHALHRWVAEDGSEWFDWS